MSLHSQLQQQAQRLLDSLSGSLSAAQQPQLTLILILALPALYILRRSIFPSSSSSSADSADSEGDKDLDTTSESSDFLEETGKKGGVGTKNSIMSAENPELDPPKDTPFTLEDLKPFDGADPSKPIYVAIKGTVFDVSAKREMYGPGKSYNIFAGKDGSRGLGMSSLKEADAVPDYSTLPENEKKVLDDWHAFFSKRYNIVGRVVDLPEAAAHL